MRTTFIPTNYLLQRLNVSLLRQQRNREPRRLPPAVPAVPMLCATPAPQLPRPNPSWGAGLVLPTPPSRVISSHRVAVRASGCCVEASLSPQGVPCPSWWLRCPGMPWLSPGGMQGSGIWVQTPTFDAGLCEEIISSLFFTRSFSPPMPSCATMMCHP